MHAPRRSTARRCPTPASTWPTLPLSPPLLRSTLLALAALCMCFVVCLCVCVYHVHKHTHTHTLSLSCMHVCIYICVCVCCRHGVPLIVDNTFGCCGALCQPIKHGASHILSLSHFPLSSFSPFFVFVFFLFSSFMYVFALKEVCFCVCVCGDVHTCVCCCRS
jgi:hypothetical protein